MTRVRPRGEPRARPCAYLWTVTTEVSPPPAPAPSRFANVNRRNLAIAIGVWIALVGVALVVATALDDSPKPVESAIPEGLPPLRLYLDRTFPAEVQKETTADAQILKLKELATMDNTPENWTNLGFAYQYLGDLKNASLFYGRALAIDPDALDARVGTILLDASASGEEGLNRAAVALDDLAAAHPTNQLVAFHQAMVATYRSDREALVPALKRTIALDPDSDFGKQAATFLAAATSSTTPPTTP